MSRTERLDRIAAAIVGGLCGNPAVNLKNVSVSGIARAAARIVDAVDDQVERDWEAERATQEALRKLTENEK